MSEGNPQGNERLWKWAYWLVFAILAVGAGRSLFRLARLWGWA